VEEKRDESEMDNTGFCQHFIHYYLLFLLLARCGMIPAWLQQLGNDARVFFVTIAVLLGIGILSLPVTLVSSGFAPFLAIFSGVFVMQQCTIWLQVDNMQRAQKLLVAQRPLGMDASLPQPDLHSMGQLFLTRGVAIAFDASVIITFVSTLISYALAGASAFGEILNTSADSAILPFVLSCFVLIVFFSRIIQPIIGALTSVKVTLLCFIIGAVGLVSEQVRVSPGVSWSTVMQPFLIGTVAIGGIADTMPVMISGLALTQRSAVIHFRWSLAAGVLACYLLNVLWGLFVLHIVPQTEADAVRRGWSEELSLEYAAANGQISTIPVTKIIDLYFPSYSWVARLVTAFIVLSICVSFNAIGIALKHALDGLAVSLLRVIAPFVGIGVAESAALLELLPSDPHAAAPSPTGSRVERCRASCDPAAAVSAMQGALRSLWTQRSLKLMLLGRGTLYVLCFGVVLLVALANPSGFLLVLSVFTSMSLNFAGGVFVALMFWGARRVHKRAVLHPSEAKGLVRGSDSDASSDHTVEVATQPERAESSSPLLTRIPPPVVPEKAAAVSVPGRQLFEDSDSIAAPVSELWGQVCAVFVCATFALAIIYDVWTSSLAPVGRSWSASFAALACALFFYHAVLPVTTVTSSPSVDAVGINSSSEGGASRELGGGDSQPAAAHSKFDDDSERVALVSSSHASESRPANALARLASLVPLHIQCEVTDIGVWILHGVHPAGDWPLAVAAAVSAVHIIVLLVLGRTVQPPGPGTPYRALPMFSTIIDVVVLSVWACIQFSFPDGALCGGLAVAMAAALMFSAVCRWSLTVSLRRAP
jgi:hypothetical protein